MKIKLTLLSALLSVCILGGCSSNQENQDSPIDTPIDNPGEQPKKEYATYEVDLTPSCISNCDSTASNFSEKMLDNINSTYTIATSVSATGYVQINDGWTKKDDSTFKALSLSSKKSDGELTITFNTEVRSFSVEVMPYAKWVAYTESWSFDAEPALYINDTLMDINPFDGVSDEVPVSTVTHIINGNTVTLKGLASQRVLITKLLVERDISNV